MWFADGVDFDLENFNTGCVTGTMNSEKTVSWIVDATLAAQAVLGSGGIITHAPQAPYFGPIGGSSWAGPTGCYTAVAARAGASITFFNLQFYNQGASCYTSYTTLFVQSGAAGLGCEYFPGTSIRCVHLLYIYCTVTSVTVRRLTLLLRCCAVRSRATVFQSRSLHWVSL